LAPGRGAILPSDGLISGLSFGPDGYYFELDGSGAPMELWIDVPYDEFIDLHFNGELWIDGEDYAVRPGSTIITITAERLEQCGPGMHTMLAAFTGETVEISFTLLIAEAAPPAEAGGTERVPFGAPADPDAPLLGNPYATPQPPPAPLTSESGGALTTLQLMAIIIGSAILLACATMLVLLKRRRRMAETGASR